MGETPDKPTNPAPSQEEAGDGKPPAPQHGDHPMFWGKPDFMPMHRKKSGDDF